MSDEIRDNLIAIFLQYNPTLAGLLRQAAHLGRPLAEVGAVIQAASRKQEPPDGALTENMALLYYEWLQETPDHAG